VAVDFGFTGRFGGFVDGDADTGHWRAWRDDQVVLHARVSGLHKKRAASAPWLNILRESEFALCVALDAAEILRTLLGGLEERYRGVWLWLAGGAVDNGAIDRGMS
jgi:hypothetical protein